MARSGVLAQATQVAPAASHREVLAEAGRMTAADDTQIVLRGADGRVLSLPPELARILTASVRELAEGHAVTVLASETTLTPAETAELLGLSRPFVVRLLDSGDLPSEHLPGSRHRVVRLADILAFQARRDRRREGRRRIADAVDEADLPY